MNKEYLIKIIAGEFDESEIEVMNYFDDIFDTLIECFRINKNVNISEFGKFFVKIRLNTEGVKEKVIKFSPVKKLADDVNYNFNNLTKMRLRTLEEKALDDIVKLQEVDVNLPEDLEMIETIEELEDIIPQKEALPEEQEEPVSEKEETIHAEETKTDLSDDKERVEDVSLEKRTEEEEEDKGFDVDTEMRSFLLEHIGSTERKEEKLKEDEHTAVIIEEEKSEEKDKALSKDELKEELEKITAEREELVTEIDELHSEKKEIEKEEEQKISTELDKILEKEEPLSIEKTEPEKEEEKPAPQELEKVSDEEKSQYTEDEKKDSEEIIIEGTEIDKEEEPPAIQELDKVSDVDLSQRTEDAKKEIEEIFAERNRIFSEVDKITDEEKSQYTEDEKKDSEEIIIEGTEIDKEEEPPVIQELDKVSAVDFSQRTEDAKKEIEEIFAERNRILDEIVDFDKPGIEEEPASKQQEEIESKDIIDKEEDKTIEEIESTKQEVLEESIPERDESDEQKDIEESISEKDELSEMINVRKKIFEKIESYKIEDFRKPHDENWVEEPQSKNDEKHETKEEIKADDIAEDDKTKTISKETVVESEEPVSKHEEVSTEGLEELRTEFNEEIETIRSGILYSKNIEEDINKILNERKKILNSIADVELDVFDKLMEDNDEEEGDSDINKDIESLSNMKTDLGKTEFNPVAENTVVSQVPAADVVETNVEFEISSDVKKLHEEIVKEDSNIKEEENMRIEDTEPKNFDDIFMQDEQKNYTEKSEEEKSENTKDTQENSDDVFK